MEIKKTKFVRKSILNKCKSFKRWRVNKLRTKVFIKVMKIGNTTVKIHSELCRLSSDERRQWYKEEMEKGNPVLLNIARVVNEIYNERIRKEIEKKNKMKDEQAPSN
jgi:hypothetical protein